MIEAVIYDMDGLLVDSEPWWRVAESNVFGRLSKAPSEAEFERMMGNRIQEVIRQWYERHPWPDFDAEATRLEIVNEVGRLVIEHAALLPGVKESLRFFRSKKLPVVLASSSPLHLIEKLTQHYGIYHEFDAFFSAENEPYGKPHPAVFITAADAIKTEASHCLVLEDSFNGVIAAKAARMKCVAIPAKEYFHQTRFDCADLKLASLLDFSEEHWKRLQ
jgi:sugar-phosphatase